ncbi:MAG TPA: DJ-1/PfpI family protein [Solirubrobacteraceae bacterium]|jgi:transcriptional regulator GlxA family with amidase domain|nr:DJ-1/PfpI family protein [Solirubrobacteraceae bacterium]
MRIEIVVFDGFDELDAIGPFEVLRNAAHAVDDLEVELVGADGGGVVTASHGLRVTVDRGLTREADLVIVPGGGWNDRAPAGARAEAERGELPARLAELHAHGAHVASVCTGAMVLAAAGLTAGRPATTHKGALDDLRASGAEVIDARVVDDGDLVTAGGVTSGLDLALHLVEREWGATLAEAIAGEMELERDRRVWTRAPTA